VIAAVEQHAPDTLVLIVTGDVRVDTAVQTLKAGAFDYVEKPLDLVGVARAVGRAVETRRLRETTSLYQTTQAVFGTLDARDLPDVIVELALDVMSADFAAIAMSRPDWTYHVEHTASAEGFEPVADTDSCAHVARVVCRDLSPLLLPEDAERVPEIDESFPCVAYPLVSRNQTFGALCVYRRDNPRGFGRRDVDRLSVLAAQASLALDNAALVSSLQQRLATLERARRRLTTAERLEGLARFATGIAHELQNPVSYMLTNLRALEEQFERLEEASQAVDSADEVGEGSSPWREAGGTEALAGAYERLQYAVEGAERVGLLAGDLSRLSRTRDDVEFDLGQAVQAAIRMAGLKSPIDVEVEEAVIRGNPGAVSKALLNLLVNAAEASGTGDRIAVVSRREEDRVRIEVSDRGHGMDAEVVDQVFEPFFTTREAPAVGLGLSVSLDIAEQHGGTVDIRSSSGRGTTAVLTLPTVGGGELLAVGED